MTEEIETDKLLNLSKFRIVKFKYLNILNCKTIC